MKKKILIFGAGAIGSVFGGFLSRRHEVSLLGRKWHLNLIKKRGLLIKGIWGKHLFKKFKLYTEINQIPKEEKFDYIFITVKANDTETAAKQIKRRFSFPITLISFQNGLGNIEILKKIFPQKFIIAGRVIFGAEIFPGEVKVTVSAAPVAIGEVWCNKITKRIQELANLLTECGIKTQAVRDIQSYLWKKAIYNSSLNALATILNVNYGKLLELEETRFLMKEIVKECYAIKKARSIKFNPSSAKGYVKNLFSELIPLTAEHHPSMLQAIKRGKHSEVEFLNGYFAKEGKRAGIATPINDLLTKIILAKEKLRIKGGR